MSIADDDEGPPSPGLLREEAQRLAGKFTQMQTEILDYFGECGVKPHPDPKMRFDYVRAIAEIRDDHEMLLAIYDITPGLEHIPTYMEMLCLAARAVRIKHHLGGVVARADQNRARARQGKIIRSRW